MLRTFWLLPLLAALGCNAVAATQLVPEIFRADVPEIFQLHAAEPATPASDAPAWRDDLFRAGEMMA